MKISELAKLCDVGVETIRYYERRGLISDPRAGKTGYREFKDEAVRRVKFIKEAQSLGFTLSEISELLSLKVSSSSTCNDVKDLAEAKLESIKEKIRTLRSFKRALNKLVEECGRSDSQGLCPILDAIEASGLDSSSRAKSRRRGL